MTNKQKKLIRYEAGQRVFNLVDSVACNLADDDFPEGADTECLEYINTTVKKVLKGAESRACKMYEKAR